MKLQASVKLLLDDRQHVALTQDEVFFVVHFTSVPAIEKMTRSPTFTSNSIFDRFPSGRNPMATHTTFLRLSFAVSGRTIPLAVFSSFSIASSTIRHPTA